MADDNLLGMIAEKLLDLILSLAGEEIKDKLKEPTNQELLFRLNKLFLQLDLESQLFITRLEQLVDYLRNPSKSEKITIQERLIFITESPTDSVRESIRDIDLTLHRIKITADHFGPILDVYEPNLLSGVIRVVDDRAGVIERANEVINYMLSPDSSLWTIFFTPEVVSSELLTDLQQTYISEKNALDLIHKARHRIQEFVRKNYPSVKDLPK